MTDRRRSVVQAAADAHAGRLSVVVAESVGAARDRVSADAIGAACGRGDGKAVVEALAAAFDAMERRLSAGEVKEPSVGVGSVLMDTLASSANATKSRL